jgi:hypothetical protein
MSHGTAENVNVTVDVAYQAQPVTLDALLGLRLDQVSWQDLEEQHPALAGALQEVVNSGYSAQQIRQYVMQRGMPMAWARWLEQAARFLEAGAE